MLQAASLRLENGLTVRLRHDPQAAEAAALIQVASGSDDEPARWPGLAHLLEHMLFTGSEAFSGAQRLISWVPAQGGRLNATTRADRTAFFFSLAPARLEPGLARLTDMLARPLFTPEALAQEVTVIDAEYRLLRGDAQMLSAAAQRHLFSGPAAMHRFHVGSRASFGDDLPALRRALRDFHQQRYHAAAMTLWLLGPQPLEELALLGRRYGVLLPTAQPLSLPPPEAVSLRASGDAMVCIAGATLLRLTFALNRWQERDAGECALLQQLLSDETEGGLLAQLRTQDSCDGISLQECWRGGGAALIAVCFEAFDASSERAMLLEMMLRQWLAQAATLSGGQLGHYAALAWQRFAGKSALDRLCEEAFGFAPLPQADINRWRDFLARLQSAEISRLWLDETLEGDLRTSAGFDFISDPFTPAPLSAPPLRFSFWPFPPLAVPKALPETSAPLFYLPAAAPAVLTLRPRPEKPIGDALGYGLQASLRALAASLAHQGATLCVERQQGSWQLQLSGGADLMRAALAAIVARLRSFSAVAQGERAWQRQQQQVRGEIPVRRLLHQLSAWLITEPVTEDLLQIEWQAALVGGNVTLYEDLARLLSQLPGRIRPAARWRLHGPVAGGWHTVSQPRSDTALLLFCPLTQPDTEAQLAWRLLALICQPLFFQRLRVEQQVGYVASCHFHHVADREGILFALQSPQLSGDALYQHTQRFLNDVAGDIARLTAQQLAEKRARLWQQLQPEGDALMRARHALAFPDLVSPGAQAALQRLDGDALLIWHRALCDPMPWQRCTAQASGCRQYPALRADA